MLLIIAPDKPNKLLCGRNHVFSETYISLMHKLFISCKRSQGRWTKKGREKQKGTGKKTNGLQRWDKKQDSKSSELQEDINQCCREKCGWCLDSCWFSLSLKIY